MKLSQRVSRLAPSMTLAIDAKAKELKAQGVDIIGFGAGEPDFDTPEAVKQEAKTALDQGFTKYVPVQGINELRQAVADYYNEEHGLRYKKENVHVSVGGKGVLYNAIQSLVDPGDEVVIPGPYWVSYPPMVELAGGKPVILETTDATGFKTNPGQIASAITEKTRLLIINSPSNPTGAAYEREELEAIAKLAIERNVFVISDEIYDKIVYDGFQFVSFPSLDPRLEELCLVANGVSKTYSMTGWRVGYGVGPKSLIDAMGSLQGQSTSGTCSIAQKAAWRAIAGEQEELVDMLAAFARRRDLIVERLNRMEGVSVIGPMGAFYAFPNVSAYYGKSFEGRTIKGSMDLTGFLLDVAKVAVVPGIGFGADDYIRLSFATDDESIIEGLNRIEDALARLS